jgi:hypothetical protein
MAIDPLKFSAGIARFSEKPWFHVFEIISRVVLGVLFLVFAEKTAFPMAIKVLGGILCFVGLFLAVIGENRHKRFAQLTAGIGKNFRFLGFFAILCGGVIIYLGGS